MQNIESMGKLEDLVGSQRSATTNSQEDGYLTSMALLDPSAMSQARSQEIGSIVRQVSV